MNNRLSRKEVKHYIENSAAYLNEKKKQRILFELFSNSFMILRSVYLFKNFDAYAEQLLADKNEDKKDEYWRASYSEKLIDYVKISIAFETFNKAILLEAGYLVHEIRKNSGNRELHKEQKQGTPIKISDFLKVSKEEYDPYKEGVYLTGFNNNFSTINYSLTLSENYQSIINLDKDLCYQLKIINEKRNRLHFYTEFKGAYSVNEHIKKWKFIKEASFDTIEGKHNLFNETYEGY